MPDPVVQGIHTVSEDHPWIERVGDHAQRKDSILYTHSRALMILLVQAAQPWFFGPPAYQDHHGGSLWVIKDGKPILLLLPAGIEWSMQFCCDPKKVDALRLQAKTVVDAFPETIPWYEARGYTDGRRLLDTPITDAAGVADWTDGIFNAGVPLPAGAHTGVLSQKNQAAGYHHYPKPIVDGEFVKYDDFQLFVTDEEGQVAAVAPVDVRGSGNGKVRVVYSTPGTSLDARHQAAHDAGEALIMDEHSLLATQAFVHQTSPAPTPG